MNERARRILPWALAAVLPLAVILSWWARATFEPTTLGPLAVEADGAAAPRPIAELAAPRPTVAEPREREARVPDPPAPVSGAAAPEDALRGVTVDTRGRPLAGVDVTFARVVQYPGGERVERLTAVSGADGAFVVEPFTDAFVEAHVAAERPGYLLVEASSVWRSVGGAWAPIEVVMASVARIELVVEDARGRPLPGLFVAVTLTAAESAPHGGPEWAGGTAKTDRDGRVSLDVPADKKLRVTVNDGDWRLDAEHVVAGVLVAEPEGEPLLMAPGEERALTARLGRTLLVHGTVLHPDRTPVAGANVRLFDRDPASFGWYDSRAETQADSGGRFRFDLHDVPDDVQLVLLAVDGPWIQLTGRAFEHGARLRVDVADAESRVLAVEVLLERTLELAGRALLADGSLFDGVVWAVPAGAEYVLEKNGLGLLPVTGLRPREEGTFVVSGLLPGVYDIVVKRNNPRTYHRFEGFVAGTRGIELRIEEDRAARIHLRVEGGADGVRLQPILLRHQYRRRRAPPAASAPGPVRITDAPARRLRAREGSWNEEEAEGRTIELVEPARRSREHDFAPQQPGWYSVGFRASDAAGRAYAPRLSEPHYLGEGDHEFVARLVPTTRIVGEAPTTRGADAFVEVLDSSGRRVPRADGEPFWPTDAEGAFTVEAAPLGPLRVRVGTWSQLERGYARREIRVDAAEALTRVTFD